ALTDRHHAEQFEKATQIPALVNAFQHDEAHRARTRDLDDGPVDPADVIAEQQYPAALRNISEALHTHAITARHGVGEDETHQRLRQLQYGVAGADQRDEGNHQQQQFGTHAEHRD